MVTRVESASPSVPNQREVLLTAVSEAIQTEPNRLQMFAVVLCRMSASTNNVHLGQAILNDFGKYSNVFTVYHNNQFDSSSAYSQFSIHYFIDYTT